MIPFTFNLLVAFCLPAMLLTFPSRGASAQCSQETLRGPASSFQPAAPIQSNQLIIAKDDSSSSSDAAMDVRFATGSAITGLEDKTMQVMTDAPISSRTTKAGAKLPVTVTQDVVVDGILVIPCGARVYGTVAAAKQCGRLTGASSLTLKLTELDLDGRTYPLYTPAFKVVGQSKTRPTANKVAIGAAVGALAVDSKVPAVGYKIAPGDRAKGDAVVAGMVQE
jgi:hypothetical protein